MKTAYFLIFTLLVLSLSGCGNFSPRSPKINNQNGKIEELKNNQNGIIADLEAFKNQQSIQNSRLDKIQQGIINLQSVYENSGIQVLSGPGGTMVAIIGLGCLTIMVLHYRSESKKYEKTANILAKEIVFSDNLEIENAVFEKALNTNCEEKILNLIKKQKSLKATQNN
jgi:hypothetical protein